MKKNKIILLVLVAAAIVTISFVVNNVQADSDGDKINDIFDNCPNITNHSQDDFDGDKLGDVCDFDDDNDGIVDAIDAFDKNPNEWDDFDFDGIGANEDTDDDNDGILDINDTSPSPVATHLITEYTDLIEDCAIMDPGFPRQLCYGDFFVSLVEKGENSADVVKLSFFFTKIDAIDDCHYTTHAVGYAAFQENPDLTETLMMTVPYCRAGFHHGFLMGFFENLKKEGKDISNLYKTVCDELVDTIHHAPCLHGIGHGLMFYYESDLKSSVDTCHELPAEPLDHCIDGVMMQYTENELAGPMSFEELEEIIPEICYKIELTSVDIHSCLFQTGRTLAFITNHDFIKASTLCNEIEDSDSVSICVKGIQIEMFYSSLLS